MHTTMRRCTPQNSGRQEEIDNRTIYKYTTIRFLGGCGGGGGGAQIRLKSKIIHGYSTQHSTPDFHMPVTITVARQMQDAIPSPFGSCQITIAHFPQRSLEH